MSTHFKASLSNLHTGAEVRLSLKITSISTEFFIFAKVKTIVQIYVTNRIQGMLFQFFLGGGGGVFCLFVFNRIFIPVELHTYMQHVLILSILLFPLGTPLELP